MLPFWLFSDFSTRRLVPNGAGDIAHLRGRHAKCVTIESDGPQVTEWRRPALKLQFGFVRIDFWISLSADGDGG